MIDSFLDLHVKLSNTPFAELTTKLFHYTVNKDGWVFKGGSLFKAIHPAFFKNHSNSLDNPNLFNQDFSVPLLAYNAIEKMADTKEGWEHIKKQPRANNKLGHNTIAKIVTPIESNLPLIPISIDLTKVYGLEKEEKEWLEENGYLYFGEKRKIHLTPPLYQKLLFTDGDYVREYPYKIERVIVEKNGIQYTLEPKQYFDNYFAGINVLKVEYSPYMPRIEDVRTPSGGAYFKSVGNTNLKSKISHPLRETTLVVKPLIELDENKYIPIIKEELSNEEQIEELRQQEQEELSKMIPNIEKYKVDGKVDKSLIKNKKDLKIYNEIYDRYDVLISPLMENKLDLNTFKNATLAVLKNLNPDFEFSKELTEENNNPSEFTNHSGGAEGSDIQWDKIGKEFGFVNNKHYWTETKTPHGNTEITKEDFEEGRYESAKAAKRNFGYQYAAMKDSKLIRNWSQVKHSDAVFAIGKIVDTGEKIFPNQKSDTRVAQTPSVTGGTGYAVGMSINHNKPTYVFNQSKSAKYDIGWYKWEGNDFVKTEIPTLTKNFAGVGTREINENGKKAIRDVYEKTFNIPTNAETKTTVEKQQDVAEQIYSQLNPNSENVVITAFGKDIDRESIIKKEGGTDVLYDWRAVNKNKHFGNPFTSVQSIFDKHPNDLIKTNSTKESVEKYIDWIINDDFYTEDNNGRFYNNIQIERRNWIREQLKLGKLKGVKLHYANTAAKKSNEPSHANALDYLINKYDWNTKSTNEKQQQPSTNQEGVYTFIDFARDNKGKSVSIKYDKYKTPFQAVITGEVEVEISGSDALGEYEYVGVQVRSNTGKLLTANPFHEIEGDIVGKEKLTNTSNLIRINKKQLSTKDNPIVVYVDGSDIKGTGAIGFGVNTTKDNNEYSISGSFDTKDLKDLEKDLGIKIENNPSNAVMEFYGSLVAIRNTPNNEFIEIRQDLEGVQLWILSGMMEKLSKQTLDTKKKYDSWYKSLTENQKQDYYERIQNVIGLDKTLISKFDWDGRKGFYAEDKTIKAIQNKIIDLILDRKDLIKYKWVKGHSGEIGNEKVDTIAKDRNNYNTYKNLFNSQITPPKNNLNNEGTLPPDCKTLS